MAKIQNNNRAISSVRIMAEVGMEEGLTLDQCLENTGISHTDFQDSETKVTRLQELQVVKNLVSNLSDSFGLGVKVGLRYQVTSFGIWGFAILSSLTVRSAIEVGIRYAGLSYVLVNFTFTESQDEGEIRMELDDIPKELHQFVIERHLTILYVLTREILGGVGIQPKSVYLSLDDFPNKEFFVKVMGDAFHFSAEKNSILFDKAFLDHPLPKANPTTAAFCIRQCDELLDSQQKKEGAAGQVRSLCIEQLANVPSLEEMAKQLNISPRTLRRRLSDEGTSYREILESTREGIAIEMLTTAQLSVESVSERLGYSEPSSFIHAFTRWTGKSPGQYRRSNS